VQNPASGLPERIALFNGPRQCAYVEHWDDQLSPHFMVFAVTGTLKNSTGALTLQPTTELVNGFDTLDGAKEAARSICAAGEFGKSFH